MPAFLARRLLQMIPVLFGITLIGFVLITAIPGDRAVVMLGEQASKAEIAAERRRLGLDRHPAIQYAFYMGGLLQGDLGYSHRQKRPVLDVITDALGVTIRLALGAMAVALGIGLITGLISAVKSGGAVDLVASGAALVGVSIPAFWLAMLLILLFGANLKWLPISGYEPGDIRYLILPAISLGLITTAIISRLTRSAMLETLSQDYVRTARAKGLGGPAVVLRHALSNALVPILTVLGTNTAGLLSGAVLTETVFGLPGLGRIVVTAIMKREYFVLMGCLLVTALIFVVVNLLVDVLYALVDPRIRYGGQHT